MYWNVFYTAIGLTQNTLIFPETGRGVFLVWFWFILTQCLPRCKAGHINIHHMPPNEVSGAWFSQQVVWFPGPSDNRLPHAVWKIPLFSGEIYEGGSVPFSSQQPLWSHSPLVDCLPNGHWQMGLKIASLAPLPQKPTVVGQHAAAFPSFNFPLLIFFFFALSVFRVLQITHSYFLWPPPLFLLFTSPFVGMEVDKVYSLVRLLTASWHRTALNLCRQPLISFHVT